MQKSVFDEVKDLISKRINYKALKLSMCDVHHPGLFSLVIDGTEHGSLTRVFIAFQDIKPFAIKLHSHTYNLKLAVVEGEFVHHTAKEFDNKDTHNIVRIDKYHYHSPLNHSDKSGFHYISNNLYNLYDYHIPEGGEIYLSHKQIHTVSVSKGTMWIVKELGKETDYNIVLGRKFETSDLYKSVEDPIKFLMYERFCKAIESY